MLGLVPALSLTSGAVVVALISAGLALFWAQLRSRSLKWSLALSAPIVVAYSLYWLPVWLGADSAEHSTWAPLFIGPWSLAGAAVSLLVVHLDARRQSRATTLRERQPRS
jgi:hypothetical protein